jgi:hypothetical protein
LTGLECILGRIYQQVMGVMFHGKNNAFIKFLTFVPSIVSLGKWI